MTVYQLTPTGHVVPLRVVDGDEFDDMLEPVRCRHCGTVYDLCATTPTARYADCTVFRTPCCDRTADDRLWLRHFTRLRDEPGILRSGW